MSASPAGSERATPVDWRSAEPSGADETCCTAERVAKIAFAIFVVCALIVTTAAVCMHYPSASHICYSLFGAIGGLSLIAAALATVRYCSEPADPTYAVLQDDPAF